MHQLKRKLRQSSKLSAIGDWRHDLTGKHVTLKTDQRSVSYMFDKRQKSKIKNDKIMRWHMELSCFDFDIRYHPWKENIPPDTFSRSYCSSTCQDHHSLLDLHESHVCTTSWNLETCLTWWKMCERWPVHAKSVQSENLDCISQKGLIS